MTPLPPSATAWLDPAAIQAALEPAASAAADPGRVAAILDKARELHGLDADEVAVLTQVRVPAAIEALFATARAVKEAIYGRRMVLFAPLYVSNHCGNECLYCAFRASNRKLLRHSLTQQEIAAEAAVLVSQGHKRVLLVTGEAYPGGFDYVLDAIRTIYEVKRDHGEIRRINANLAPLTVPQFQALHAAGIGTYQLFQETYDRQVYARMHPSGRKADFDWRLTAMDRAMTAGIDDVGMGVLFGLADWRFDLLALMRHIAHLEARFGVGAHTVSVPRLEPAHGSELASHPPQAVSDEDFKKLVAILRLAVPYTGIIMSTRESAQMRRETYALGVSQISAGSRTNPGGYADEQRFDAGQFQLGDHRPLEEVVRELAELGYIPSFCTACYRVGRTGEDFMDLAKAGEIKHRCGPNAVSTFLEYLLDYAGPGTCAAGEASIATEIADMDAKDARVARKLVEKVRGGKRDAFC